jgi:group I intron endonuclease
MQICRAILIYGYSNFILEILEYCEPDKCLEKEDYYINFIGSEYNTVKNPILPPMSGRTYSDETRIKMSDSHKKIDHSGRLR